MAEAMALWIEAPAGAGAVDELAAALHPGDAAELAAAGLAGVAAAVAGAELSALRLADGRLVCLFGCARHPDGTSGIPWMLCTTALASVPRRAMAEVSIAVAERWRREYPRLTNLVHRSNARAIRFIQWLGFTVLRRPCGPGGEFFLFGWSNDV